MDDNIPPPIQSANETHNIVRLEIGDFPLDDAVQILFENEFGESVHLIVPKQLMCDLVEFFQEIDTGLGGSQAVN